MVHGVLFIQTRRLRRIVLSEAPDCSRPSAAEFAAYVQSRSGQFGQKAIKLYTIESREAEQLPIPLPTPTTAVDGLIARRH